MARPLRVELDPDRGGLLEPPWDSSAWTGAVGIGDLTVVPEDHFSTHYFIHQGIAFMHGRVSLVDDPVFSGGFHVWISAGGLPVEHRPASEAQSFAYLDPQNASQGPRIVTVKVMPDGSVLMDDEGEILRLDGDVVYIVSRVFWPTPDAISDTTPTLGQPPDGPEFTWLTGGWGRHPREYGANDVIHGEGTISPETGDPGYLHSPGTIPQRLVPAEDAIYPLLGENNVHSLLVQPVDRSAAVTRGYNVIDDEALVSLIWLTEEGVPQNLSVVDIGLTDDWGELTWGDETDEPFSSRPPEFVSWETKPTEWFEVATAVGSDQTSDLLRFESWAHMAWQPHAVTGDLDDPTQFYVPLSMSLYVTDTGDIVDSHPGEPQEGIHCLLAQWAVTDLDGPLQLFMGVTRVFGTTAHTLIASTLLETPLPDEEKDVLLWVETWAEPYIGPDPPFGGEPFVMIHIRMRNPLQGPAGFIHWTLGPSGSTTGGAFGGDVGALSGNSALTPLPLEAVTGDLGFGLVPDDWHEEEGGHDYWLGGTKATIIQVEAYTVGLPPIDGALDTDGYCVRALTAAGGQPIMLSP